MIIKHDNIFIFKIVFTYMISLNIFLKAILLSYYSFSFFILLFIYNVLNIAFKVNWMT